ncbi:hypothetical protein BD414DRAFT_579214 [Trametes punicea]|nr:hypothetical protein BD414DRAFT_579214 [Trametes punicea]
MDVVSVYNTIMMESLGLASMFALMIYEFLITLDREVALFWNAKFTRTTIVFLLNRYMSLLKYPVAMLADWPTSQSGCEVITRLTDVLEIIPYFVWAIFSATRVHALTGGQWILCLTVFVLSSMPIWTNMYLIVQTVPENMSAPLGCSTIISLPVAVYTAALLLTRICAMLSDTIVIVITWNTTFHGWKAASAARLNISLSEIILRDSSIYFVILLAINVVHLICSFTSTLTIFPALVAEPLTAITITRTMLNLRDADQLASHTETNSDIHSLELRISCLGTRRSATNVARGFGNSSSQSPRHISNDSLEERGAFDNRL